MTDFYFDSNAADDSGDGSFERPWKNILRLRDGYGGQGHNFYLESNSHWTFVSTRFDEISSLEIYNDGANGGLNGNISGTSRSLISNYYANGINTGKLPKFTKHFLLMSNAQCKGYWTYDSNWGAWRLSFKDYVADVAVNLSTSEFTLSGSELTPRAGCSATFSGSGTIPTLTGGTQPTASTKVFLYPTSGRNVRVYANYNDALAGNSNYYTVAAIGSSVKLSVTPSRGIKAATNSSAIMFPNRKWGIGFNQLGITAAKFKTECETYGGQFKYSAGYADTGGLLSSGTDLLVWSPESQDPVEFYGEIKLFHGSVFSFWNPRGLTIQNLEFVECSGCILNMAGFGTVYTTNTPQSNTSPFEVRNIRVSYSKEGISNQLTSVPRSETSFSYYNNSFIKMGGYGISTYGGSGYAGSIGTVKIFNNYFDECNMSFSMGGAIYMSSRTPNYKQLIYGNKVVRAWNAVGNCYHDGCGIYLETGTSGVIVYGNYLEECPVAFQDNSGESNLWFGNILNKCGVALRLTDESQNVSTNFRFINNTIYDIQHSVPQYQGPIRQISDRFQIVNYQNGYQVALPSYSNSTFTMTESAEEWRKSPATGAQVRFIDTTGTSTLPAGLEFNTRYYVVRVGSTTFRLCRSVEDSWNSAEVSFEGSITGTTLTTPAPASITYGRVAVGQTLYGTGVLPDTVISAKISDTEWTVSKNHSSSTGTVRIYAGAKFIIVPDGTNLTGVRLRVDFQYEVSGNIFHCVKPHPEGLSTYAWGGNFGNWGNNFLIQNNTYYGLTGFLVRYDFTPITDTYSTGTVEGDPQLGPDLRPLPGSPVIGTGVGVNFSIGADLSEFMSPVPRGALERKSID